VRWKTLLTIAVLGAAAAIAFTRPVGTDYGNLGCRLHVPYCDDAKPQLDALAHGHVSALWQDQTVLGPVSIVLRWPFVAAARLFGAGDRVSYRFGVLACLLALALAALLVASEMRQLGRPRWLEAVVALGIVVNPLTFRVAHFGHPEEAVAAAAVLAAAVFAARGQAVRSGVMTGAAIATKLWGILAAVPILLALPQRLWARGAAAVAAAVALLYLPAVAGDPARFYHAASSANDLGTIPGTAQASNLWWYFMDKAPYQQAVAVHDGKVVFQEQVGWVLGSPLGHIVHPLVVGLAIALTLLWAFTRRPGAPPHDVLLLLAAIFLMRCLLDPNNYSYYHLPFLVCLIAYEGMTRRFPWLSLTSVIGLQLIISLSPHIHSDAGFVRVYLAWALPTLVALLVGLSRVRWRERALAGVSG
jgi:hypothetical protein